jgi:hypothetical protein
MTSGNTMCRALCPCMARCSTRGTPAQHNIIVCQRTATPHAQQLAEHTGSTAPNPKPQATSCRTCTNCRSASSCRPTTSSMLQPRM